MNNAAKADPRYADMVFYLKSLYGDHYSMELIEQTVDLYLQGVRDSRLHDIAISLIDRWGF